MYVFHNISSQQGYYMQWRNNVVKGPWCKQIKGPYFCYNHAGGGEGEGDGCGKNTSNFLQ